MHYAVPLSEDDHSGISISIRDSAPTYTAGMFLLLRSHLSIPPDTPVIHGDMNCQVGRNTSQPELTSDKHVNFWYK